MRCEMLSPNLALTIVMAMNNELPATVFCLFSQLFSSSLFIFLKRWSTVRQSFAKLKYFLRFLSQLKKGDVKLGVWCYMSCWLNDCVYRELYWAVGIEHVFAWMLFADSHLTRKVPASYSDGVYMMGGLNRPNPRKLSELFMKGPDGLGSVMNRTALFAFFGTYNLFCH